MRQTFEEYLNSHRSDTMTELNILTGAKPPITPERVYNNLCNLASQKSELYNEGFDDAMTIIRQLDPIFLKRRVSR